VLPGPEAARRLRTALDPDGDWITHVLRDANEQLLQLRGGEHPNAGALVIAIDKEHADKLADRLARITGERPDVVHSDAADASARIARFSAGSAPWLVSVLMVSEGVDVPRLRVGVYATTARTELFFRQVIGRFIRRTPAPKEQMSHVFLPSDPKLKRLAISIEEERNHALVFASKGEEEVERGERSEAKEPFKALWSSARRDEDVLQTTQPGENLQLFAEPTPPALAGFTVISPSSTAAVEPETAFERRERLRAERQALVGAIARKTGEAHAQVNARVNRQVGAESVNKSTDEQLERANRLLEKEVNRRR
jgi:superfamily II DNA or RNA helicase